MRRQETNHAKVEASNMKHLRYDKFYENEVFVNGNLCGKKMIGAH